MLRSELTRQHFSTKAYKAYLHLLRTNFPDIDVEALCVRAGLPLSYVTDENNWASVTFDAEFCRLCIEWSGQKDFCFQAGLQNSREAVLGRVVYLLAKYSLSMDLTYRQVPRLTEFYSQVTRLEIVGVMSGLIRYRLSPHRLETLSESEKKAFRNNYANVILNHVGHFSALPMIQDLPCAKVDYEQVDQIEGIPVYEIRVSYPGSQKLAKHLALAARFGFHSIVSAAAALLVSLSGAPIPGGVFLFSACFLLLELLRSWRAVRNFFRVLELSRRDYELLDRRYEALQTAKEALETISGVNAHYRALVDEMQLGVCIVRADSTSEHGVAPVITNHAFERLGQFAGDVRSRSEFLPAVLNECIPLVRRALESGNAEMIDTLPLRLPDPIGLQYYSLHVFPVHPNRAGILLENITAKTLYRIALDEQKVRAVQTGKLAALGEMAAGISHELNNPLTIIRAHAEKVSLLMTEGVTSPEHFARIELAANKITATVDRMVKIIRGVRAMSRDASRDPMSAHDLNRILGDSLELCEKWITSLGVQIRTTGFYPGMNLHCRDVEIAQVLVNLIRNASDAVMGLDEKWIEISVSESPKYYEMRIKDSGSGIPQAVRERIFRPFFTTKEVGQGTGLGLSIARGILENHHGKLELDENSSHTCFVLLLPKTHPGSSNSTEPGPAHSAA